MALNSSEHPSELHANILERFQLVLGIVGRDTIDGNIEENYISYIDEIPVETLKYMNSALHYIFRQDSVPLDEHEELSITTKIGLGMGLIIGSRIIGEDRADEYFDEFHNDLYLMCLQADGNGVEGMLKTRGGLFRSELKKLNPPYWVFDAHDDGFTADYDFRRNQLHSSALSFAASGAYCMLMADAIDLTEL